MTHRGHDGFKIIAAVFGILHRSDKQIGVVETPVILCALIGKNQLCHLILHLQGILNNAPAAVFGIVSVHGIADRFLQLICIVIILGKGFHARDPDASVLAEFRR